MTKWIEEPCPECGVEEMLKFHEQGLSGNYLYCHQCDRLWKERGDKLVALVRTQEPYADFSTMMKDRR